jgi:eukaryotic-like serine/threonine-protein kinase
VTPERWQEVKKALAAALERSPEERRAYLDQACAEPALRREVESLILAHEQGDRSFMEQPAVQLEELAIGSRLGPYEILARIGAGGMGDVYQARDTKLGRSVAVKVLPLAFVDNPDRVTRFQREARMLASLNHPNIASIYGLEDSGGTQALVMELVEGPTLADRIKSGPVAVDETLRIAKQITEALEYAHERGIVHRDLKPANVKLTSGGRVKVLDFGLAKALAGDGGVDLSQSPTLTAAETTEGTILGTPAYMSPEQVRGKSVDKRTDNWAFGCVLYELLTARRAFQGETLADTIAAVLEKEPDWQALPPTTPARVQDLLRRCLQKDSQRRLRDLGDAGIELEESSAALTPATTRAQSDSSMRLGAPPNDARQKRVRWAIASAVAVLFVGGGLLVARYALPVRAQTIHSVAVLPFTGSSANPDAEFLQDGISVGVTDALSQLPGLKVMSSSAAQRYARKNPDPEKVGSDLKVDAVLVGKVEQHGDTISINAELVNAADNSQIWGEQYTEKVADAAAFQQEIVRTISEKLRTKLTPAEKGRLDKRPAEDIDAYRSYVLGRHEFDKFSYQGFAKAAEYFQQALDKDPNYSAAYAGLSDTYNLLGLYRAMPQKEALAKARAAATQALALDDNSAEAHLAIAVVHWYSWEFSAVEPEYRRAVELNPNFANAHESYSDYLRSMGRPSEALEEDRRALELDPSSLFASDLEGLIFMAQRDYEKAIAQEQKTLEIDPNFALAYEALAGCYIAEGMDDKAADALERMTALFGQPEAAAELRRVYATSGMKGVYQWTIKQQNDPAKPAYNPVNVAVNYAFLGDKDKAFYWLEKAYEQRAFEVVFLKGNPGFDTLHSDPRYADLLRRIGFPQ